METGERVRRREHLPDQSERRRLVPGSHAALGFIAAAAAWSPEVPGGRSTAVSKDASASWTKSLVEGRDKGTLLRTLIWAKARLPRAATNYDADELLLLLLLLLLLPLLLLLLLPLLPLHKHRTVEKQ